jgi:chaperonin cofactor prefoldin
LESLQHQLQELAHKERSSANRVSTFMRENNQLKAQLDELRKQLPW